MKKITTFLFMALLFMAAGCEYDDSGLNDRLDGLEDRVGQLEKLCEGFNDDIVSMQTIVEALQNNDYVVSVDPILDNGKTVGYAITFSKSGVVKIYCGKDGADGEDGQDGSDGYIPLIGVKKASDGYYYWTLDGEWMLDEDGNKIRATGRNGQDGEDGADGEDGQNGQDGSDGADGQPGKDGVTPKLKIEDGQWYVSYNNGQDWILLDQATAPDGTNGQDGQSYFDRVTVEDGYVNVVLKTGEELKLQLLTDEFTDVVSSVVFVPVISENIKMYDYVGKGCFTDTLEYRISPAYLVPKIIERLKSDPDAVSGNLYLLPDHDEYMNPMSISADAQIEVVKMPATVIEGDEKTGIISLVLSGEYITEDQHFKIDWTSRENRQVTLTVSYGAEPKESDSVTMRYYLRGKYLLVDFAENQCPSREELRDTLSRYYGPEELKELRMSQTYGVSLIGLDNKVEVLEPCFRHMETVIYVEENGLSRLADNAFAGNTSLEYFYADDITDIGEAAFKGCSGLRSIEFDEELLSAGKQAFMDCPNLREIYIDITQLDIIPDEIFKNSTCPYLGNTFKAKVIGKGAFEGCREIGYIYSEAFSFVEVVEEDAFRNTLGLETITLPSIVEIKADAFRNSSVHLVDLGENIQKIHTGAFFDNIEDEYGYIFSMEIPALEVPELVGGPIFNVSGESQKVYVYVPASMLDVYKADPDWSAMERCFFQSMN